MILYENFTLVIPFVIFFMLESETVTFYFFIMERPVYFAFLKAIFI